MARPTWFVGRTKVHRKAHQKKRPLCHTHDASKCRPTDENLSGANVTQIDPDEEREPPPDATHLSFPSVQTPECKTWSAETLPPNFQLLFTKILKPSDISDCHLKSLNIDLREQCAVEELLPSQTDGSSYFPSLAASEQPGGSDTPSADAIRTDPVLRKRKEFNDRVTELQAQNLQAYRAITRSTKPGVKPPRLAFMRNFWQGMESMSQYWDCTLDQYFAADDTDENGQKSPKRQKLDADGNTSITTNFESGNTLPMRTANDGNDVESTSAAMEPVTRSRSYDASNGDEIPDTQITASETSTGRSGVRYKGLRTNTGRYMPDQFRVDTVRGFVEGTIWPFQCNVHPPRMMPLVHFNKLKLPVRQSVAVYRLPKDRDRAREGGIVGPVLGVQVRSDTEFGDDEGKARLDVMREIGGLLQIAQERAREGKKEVKPGEGKWWTTVPRWGGAPGGEVEENQQGNSDIIQIATELLAATKGEAGKGGEDAATRKRTKKPPAMLWKELKRGSGYFDPKTDYEAIGKDPASDVDEVFLVSSLNHHISVLKLTVHRAYIDYLLSATMPDPLPQDPSWCRPILQRSKWFDLFLEEDRVESFRGLWGVMAYLTRETGVEAEKVNG